MQIPQLAYQIAEYIKSERLPEGTRLPGRKLAEQFRVSRSPIERALRLLEAHRVVSSSGRIVIEPAAILEPTFELDRPAIEACRAEQVALFDARGPGLSPVQVFDIGSRFHQVVLNCSKNPFFIRGLDHANRTRRLVEYKKTLNSSHWRERCQEHARIAELLLDGDRAAAAKMLHGHLEQGMREKTLAGATTTGPTAG